MSDPAPKKTLLIGRNTLALLQILSVGLAILFISFTLPQIAPRLDLTQQKSFSLSEYTRNLLRSELVKSKDLTLHCLADQSSPYFERAQVILSEYERVSNGRIQVSFVDPHKHPEQAFQLIEKYKVHPTDDLIIIDDGTAERPSIIPFADLMVFEVTAQKQRKLSAYQVEDVMTTTLLNQLENKRRTVYFIADNTKDTSIQEDSIGATLQALYRNQNIDLHPLLLSEVDQIPEDASGLLFLTPEYDIEPSALEILTDYWNKPKSSLFIVLDPDSRPKRLRAFLRSHGITQRADRVYNFESPSLSTKTIASFTKGPELNADLMGKSTIFEGVSTTLDVRESAEDLLNKRIFPLALVETSEQHYSESRFQQDGQSFTLGEDHRAGLYLGAAVIKGTETNDALASSSSRMIVLSTSEFLKPDNIRAEQIDFVKNSINWLVGRTELIGIGAKPLQRYKLNLVPAEIKFVNRLTLIILPLAFLLIGAFTWNLRRA